MIRINDKLYFEYEKIMLENGMPTHLIFKTFKELAETNMFFNHKMELQAQKDLLFDYKKENIELKQENKYYKDKEDKLRKLCENNINNHTGFESYKTIPRIILQILN